MHYLLILTFIGAVICFLNFPIEINKCKRGQWFVKNFIVFTCLSDESQRELKPIACDPTNGVIVKKRKRPIFLHETYRGEGFIYECARDKYSDGIMWRAVACYINGERFPPGTFVKGRYDSVYLCYRDTDNIVRIRIRKPFHDHCVAGKRDPNCQRGIIQGIWNSEFSIATGIKYDAKTNRPFDLLEAADDANQNTTNAPFYGYPKLSSENLLRSIQGQVNPEFVTEPPEINNQLGKTLPKQ
ncbi:unnamed protein product [Haemonchus placei]|uniref:ZP domain-containing protein n=1 Tax=Haemonchus placei TaxID=6290 RepID=A0A0N4W1V5_HAEPC|nr:unnamed protein product [Haemonchus placei]